jgi:hypothetical protein
MGKYLGCTDDQVVDDHLYEVSATLFQVKRYHDAYMAVHRAALWEVQTYGQTQFPHHRAYFNIVSSMPLSDRADLLKRVTAHHANPTQYVAVTPAGIGYPTNSKRPHLTPTQIGYALVYLTIIDIQLSLNKNLGKLLMADIIKP